MPSDPFVILGVARGASQSEILEAYKQKRAYYQQHVFDEGEAGADAARMLEVLDNAYQDAMSQTHEAATVGGDPDSEQSRYQDVKAAVSARDFERAQTLLDDMYYRGGEWHYYQAIIFYEKNWLNESKKQLELAVDLEPENDKYKRALEANYGRGVSAEEAQRVTVEVVKNLRAAGAEVFHVYKAYPSISQHRRSHRYFWIRGSTAWCSGWF